jgi:hypothetical protein
MFQSGTVLRHSFWTTVVSAWLCVDTSSASAAAAHTTKAACEADPGWTWLSSASPISRKTSAPSLVAASVMGAEGFSRVPPSLPAMWESSLLTKCSDNSSAGNLWFDRCSPDGMVNTINREFRQNWHVNTYISDDWEQLNAIQYMISVLRYFGSPSVVPIHGRGDHFLTAENICVKFKPDGRTLSSFDVSTFHDAVFSTDGAGNPSKGSNSFSGREFRNDFYEILSNIGPGCPGPCPDPYYNKYILMNDPPEGAALLTSPVNRELEFVRFPGIVPKGEMTAARGDPGRQKVTSRSGLSGRPGCRQSPRPRHGAPSVCGDHAGSEGSTYGVVHRTDSLRPRWCQLVCTDERRRRCHRADLYAGHTIYLSACLLAAGANAGSAADTER